MARLFSAPLALAFSLALFAQDTTDKMELRFRFEEGEQLSLHIKQKMNVKIDEAPEMFQDFLGEEPFDLALDGTADFKVTGIDGEGTATLTGKFQTLTAKGAIMMNELDFAYDREKHGDEPPGSDEEQDPGMPGIPNPGEAFRQLVVAKLTLKIDKFGKMQFDGAEAAGQQMGAQLFNLSALVGVLPKEKVGKGDIWKNEDRLQLPGLPLKMKVSSKNTYADLEKKNDVECVVIKSEFTVGTESGEDAPPPDMPFQFDGKFTGKGDGTMYFNAAAGRPVENSVKLDVKVEVNMPDPQGGDDVQIKGRFKMEQSNELKKK